MKVLVVSNMYPTSKHPFYGIFVREQVESLKAEGICVDVFFINGKESRLNYFTSIIGLCKKLRSAHYDIIHAHHTYCIYTLLIARMLVRNKSSLILTFHEGEVYEPWKLFVDGNDFIKNLVHLKWLKKIALNKVDVVITVDENLIQKLGFKGKVVVLPCGVDLNLFQPKDKISCREKIGFPVDKKIIFFPTSPQRNGQKGYGIVEESLKFISRKDVTLVTGGNISHEDMPYYMSAADVVVQLSKYEASPMVIKEVMACNIPVVSTEVGDVRKVFGNSDGCYICQRNPQDVAKKIEEALQFNAETKGRNRLFEMVLGLNQISGQILQIYEQLIKK